MPKICSHSHEAIVYDEFWIVCPICQQIKELQDEKCMLVCTLNGMENQIKALKQKIKILKNKIKELKK